MIRFEDAVNKLRPNTEWICYGGNLEGLTFMDESVVKPTQKQIDDALKELEKEAETAKTSAESKLQALGLTLEDLKVLGIG